MLLWLFINHCPFSNRTYSYIISKYAELATMYFTNLLIPILLTIPGALATTSATIDDPDTLNRLSFGWLPSPDYTCCVYLTTDPEWQGARTYGCIPPNRCSELSKHISDT
jgi:hypothetical protein